MTARAQIMSSIMRFEISEGSRGCHLEMDRWREKVAVVTGASEGIGAAIVRRLAKDGMKVAALARRGELLEELESESNKQGSGGVVKGYVCDVTSGDEIKNVFKCINDDFGAISVLVNNAGLLRQFSLTDIDLNAAEGVMATNFMGLVKCTSEAIDNMKAHNSINDGHIINISSMIVKMDPTAYPQFAFYLASKLSVNNYSSSLKAQLKKDGLKTRVTVVCPGLVETTMVRGLVSDFSVAPHLVPEDIAESIVYVLAAPPHVNVHELIIGPS